MHFKIPPDSSGKRLLVARGKLTETLKGGILPDQLKWKTKVNSFNFTRMHSSRMRTARSLPYGGVGLCPGGSLSKVGLYPGGSLSKGSLSRGVSVWGISVQRGLCRGRGGVSVRETITVMYKFKRILSFAQLIVDCT